MVRLHPSILEQNGKKAFAILPYEEFQNLQEELNEYEDLKELRSAKVQEADADTTPLACVREELDI